jgi:hypothetical protein
MNRLYTTASVFVNEGFTQRQRECVFKLSGLITDAPRIFKLQDVEELIKNAKMNLEFEKKIYCCFCGEQLENTINPCRNEMCELYNNPTKVCFCLRLFMPQIFD